MRNFIFLGSEEWEMEQEYKQSQGEERSYRVLELHLGNQVNQFHRIVEQFDPEPLSCTAGSGKNCFHEVLDVPSLMQGRGGSATTVDCWPQSRAVSTIWCSLGNADISGDELPPCQRDELITLFQGDFPRRRNPERRGAANPPCMCNLAVFSRFSCLILAVV